MKKHFFAVILTAAISFLMASFLLGLVQGKFLKPFWQVDYSAGLPLFLVFLAAAAAVTTLLWRFIERQPGKTMPEGITHYFDPKRFPGKRVHLRFDGSGNAVLMVNAQKVVFLNETAAFMARLFLEERDPREALQSLRKRFREKAGVLEEDFRETSRKLRELILRDDICPITFMDIDKLPTFSMPVEVPYRMDLALTYRCNNNCGHCYNQSKEIVELDTPGWKKVISRLAVIGVPHVAFTGGEPTMRDDLAELITFAEESGIICGLLTNGVRLADRDFLLRLKAAGLDYLQITLNSQHEKIHNLCAGNNTYSETVQAIGNCLRENIYLITNTTINRHNHESVSGIVDFLASLGVKTFAMNSIIHSGKARRSPQALSEDELIPILKEVRQAAQKNEMKFIWYSPTRYCELNPMELDIGIKSCTAGKYNFVIEPDGTVIPCQSLYNPVGNILHDSWKKIYNHKFLKELRDRDWKLEICNGCELFDYCGCGCPLQIKDDSFCCPDLLSNG